MRPHIPKLLSQLLLSLAIVASAYIATLALYRFDPRLQQHGIFAFFLAAIAIASWRGDLLPALFTVILSSLIVAWVMPPPHSFRVSSPEDIVRLTLFVGLGLLIVYLHFRRHRAEESLQESDRRLSFSLDSCGVACWDANIKNGTFWKSHNLPEVFGRTQSDFATTSEGFFAYIHPEDRDFFHLATVTGGADHRDYEISHRIIAGDGTSRRVSTRGRMYMGEDGRVERMVGTVFLVESKSNAASSVNPTRNPETEVGAYSV